MQKDEGQDLLSLEKDNKQDVIRMVLAIVLAILTLFLILNVNLIQGNGSLINYAGRLRGGSQRLVKNEIAGYRDDRLMGQLDDIMTEMRSGKGNLGIHQLNDDTYNELLAAQQVQWQQLKKIIYAYRQDKSRLPELYAASETYYQLADATVDAAEDYIDTIVLKIKTLEVLDLVIFIMLGFIYANKMKGLRDLHKANSVLNTLAYVDQATGLANSRACKERLVNPDPIPEDTLLVCFMMDLNNLKPTNDKYGHEAGDKLIAGFARSLKAAAPVHMFLGRSGGDEFMGVVTRLDEAACREFVERVREAAAREEKNLPAGVKISFAEGHALSSEFPGLTVQKLMDEADKRMYVNKQLMKKALGMAPSTR
jgi:diguanylate cyclase (GGDEF)-like protein